MQAKEAEENTPRGGESTDRSDSSNNSDASEETISNNSSPLKSASKKRNQVPTLSLEVAQNFVREETPEGAAEVNYKRDASLICTDLYKKKQQEYTLEGLEEKITAIQEKLGIGGTVLVSTTSYPNHRINNPELFGNIKTNLEKNSGLKENESVIKQIQQFGLSLATFETKLSDLNRTKTQNNREFPTLVNLQYNKLDKVVRQQASPSASMQNATASTMQQEEAQLS